MALELVWEIHREFAPEVTAGEWSHTGTHSCRFNVQLGYGVLRGRIPGGRHVLSIFASTASGNQPMGAQQHRLVESRIRRFTTGQRARQ